MAGAAELEAELEELEEPEAPPTTKSTQLM